MKRKIHFSEIIWCIFILVVMGTVLLMERIGTQIRDTSKTYAFLPQSVLEMSKPEAEKVCLVLTSSNESNSSMYLEQIEYVLRDMRIGYNTVDVATETLPDDLSVYKTAVITFSDWDILLPPEGYIPQYNNDSMSLILRWVKQGGGLMFMTAPSSGTILKTYYKSIGIHEYNHTFACIGGIVLSDSFMLGGDGFEYTWDEAWECSLELTLSSDTTVYMSSNDDRRVPMIWSYSLGSGIIVVNNHAICEKITRGLIASAYNLLEDIACYPVINASTFFIDDFPAPVPQGDAKYITLYYQRSISSFFTNIWWPDMISLCNKYGIVYTGAVIEDYNDNVNAPFIHNSDIERFRYFGGMLLQSGGEIGIHGHNHMSLCLDGFDYKSHAYYNTWHSLDDMRQSLETLNEFTKSVFSGLEPTLYVPPSNILSEEGRILLKRYFPKIRIISSLLTGEADNVSFVQEFGISEDGIINLPRIVSGYILDEYSRWAVINELNFHYINTHFVHPDDILDVDRGADKGWATLFKGYEEYVSWLQRDVPNLRKLTGSEAGAALQRYTNLTVNKVFQDNHLSISLGGLYDEAYLMLRMNDGSMPIHVDGGYLEHISGNMYLLQAKSSKIDIDLKR